MQVTELVRASLVASDTEQDGFINFGWRGWEGCLPSSLLSDCPTSPTLNEKTIAFYDEAIKTSIRRLTPLTCYYHEDPRTDKLEGTAITGVQPYMGSRIPGLNGNVVFTDLARDYEHGSKSHVRGALAYTRVNVDYEISDFSVIEVDYNFGSESAFYVSLGTNLDQTELFLGVHGSMNVADYNQGAVYRIVS